MKASAVKVAALLRQAGNRDAQRMATVILEVLAGLRTPSQAAQAVSISLPRYYQLETRALIGLVAACGRRAKGRSPISEAKMLHKDNERLRQELTRQQTLVRLAQRTVGLSPAVATKGKRKRKPVVRALAAAAQLRETAENGEHASAEIS